MSTPSTVYRFTLPASWDKPIFENGRIWGAGPEGKTELSVTIHPDTGQNGPEQLTSLVLQNFGPVSLLYQDQTEVGGWADLRSVYGYEAEDGTHEGVLLALTRDGIGYVIDLDIIGIGKGDLQELAAVICQCCHSGWCGSGHISITTERRFA